MKRCQCTAIFTSSDSSSGSGRLLHAEHRRSPRVGARLPVRILLGAVEIEASTRDVGIAGAFIESGEEPEYGARVEIVLLPPAVQAELRLTGVVRWVTAAGFGLQFDSLGARETIALSSLVVAFR
jgi:hypothetical protein